MKKVICLFIRYNSAKFIGLQGKFSKKTTDSAAADSGQTHLGNDSIADSAMHPASPVEDGGKDATGNGSGTTNAPKDTLKKNP